MIEIHQDEFKKCFPFQESQDAIRSILQLLSRQLNFRIWLITEVQNDELRILACENQGYTIEEGQTFPWQDSLCYHMTQGQVPNIAPEVKQIPLYRDSPIRQKLEISSYIGYPLIKTDGKIFGSLCAFDPAPKPEHIREKSDLVLTQSRLVSTIVSMEARRKSLLEELDFEKKRSLVDELTGILNRRGWEESIAVEEERCQRYQLPAAVIIVDLDNLKKLNDSKGHFEGDKLLKKTANCLKYVLRPFDIVARIGGDEFALLINKASFDLAEKIQGRIREHLYGENISASIGWAVRSSSEVITDVVMQADEQVYCNTLNDAIHMADVRMFRDKESRKVGRSTH